MGTRSIASGLTARRLLRILYRMESVVPSPLSKWKPAELALEGRDAASFKLALALCPTRGSVLDLVQKSSVSLGVWIPYGVTVL